MTVGAGVGSSVLDTFHGRCQVRRQSEDDSAHRWGEPSGAEVRVQAGYMYLRVVSTEMIFKAVKFCEIILGVSGY